MSLAEDGQQALDLFASQDFDCILMDIHMPVMDGVEATRRIRAAEDRSQWSEIRNQRSEDRGQGTEVRDQKSEVRDQRSESDLSDLSEGASGGSESQDSPISESPNSRIPESSPELNTPAGTPVQPGKNPRIPIIALTAYAMDGDRERFLEAGMDDYLAKPVHKDDLENVLKKHCG